MGKSPKSVAPVNSTTVANQTNTANQQYAGLGVATNRPQNNVDQFGNSQAYTQTGTDANGNPIFNVNQSLGGLGQQYAQGLSGLGQQYMNFAGDPNNPANMQAFNQASNLWDQTQGQYQQRQGTQLDTQLRNQGLTPGSEAYDNATRDLGQQQSDARNSFLLNGQNQFFNQTQSSLSPGVQFANNVLSPNYSQVPQQSVGQAYSPTAIAGINQQTGLANAQAQNSYNQGLWGAGGGLLGSGLSAMGQAGGIGAFFSDARMKDNIIEVGALHNGQKVYAYNFKGDPRTQIGLMAQEVLKIHPEAVSMHSSGMLMVDYAKAVV